MAMGKFPIAVNWGGPTEFIQDETNGLLIDYDLQPVFSMFHPYPYLYTGYENWAEPSVSHLKSSMRKSYNLMQDEEFKKQQKINGLKRAEDFTYEKVGKKLSSIIEKYYSEWRTKKEEEINV